MVIRTQLSGQNDTPFGRPAPGRPSGRAGYGRTLGVFCMFQLLLISNVISIHGLPDRGTLLLCFSIVRLPVELTFNSLSLSCVSTSPLPYSESEAKTSVLQASEQASMRSRPKGGKKKDHAWAAAMGYPGYSWIPQILEPVPHFVHRLVCMPFYVSKFQRSSSNGLEIGQSKVEV
jgi:hypothetical protein